jgi:hypothetical protein
MLASPFENKPCGCAHATRIHPRQPTFFLSTPLAGLFLELITVPGGEPIARVPGHWYGAVPRHISCLVALDALWRVAVQGAQKRNRASISLSFALA